MSASSLRAKSLPIVSEPTGLRTPPLELVLLLLLELVSRSVPPFRTLMAAAATSGQLTVCTTVTPFTPPAADAIGVDDADDVDTTDDAVTPPGATEGMSTADATTVAPPPVTTPDVTPALVAAAAVMADAPPLALVASVASMGRIVFAAHSLFFGWGCCSAFFSRLSFSRYRNMTQFLRDGGEGKKEGK